MTTGTLHPRRAAALRARLSVRGASARRLTGITMTAPLIVVVLAFLGWPIVWTLALSLTNKAITGPTALHSSFIGLANYKELFASGSGLVHSILLSLYYLVASAYIGQALFGFVIAYLMRRCPYRVRAVVGSIIVVSWLVPEIIAAWMWFTLLSDGGTLAQALHGAGIGYQTWLISHPMISVSLANSWRGVAFSYLLFSAALSDIPTDLIEAAQVDGANSWRRLSRIIVPMLSATILVDLVLITLGTLNDFTLIFAMTGGGPGTDSTVLSVFMYQQAFASFQLAYGTAIAVVLLVVGAIFAVAYIRILRRQGALEVVR
ncbi:MAG TPA: sugar ABC transporter permease [Streptosporangiaceae bacterium]|nr:sugar ABC transporter permease [Streptosporangiaceae bacterium]